MLMHRLFIIAPSLARLIRQERGGERVIEGYFPDQPHRSTYVQIQETGSSLILEADEGAAPDEQADVPLAHAQALLAVSRGRVEYLRTRLSLGSHEIHVLHVVKPGPLDLVAVASAPGEGQDLPPLPWFGSEVSAKPTYRRRRLALDGAPAAPETEVTNVALNCLLDLLEDRITTWPLLEQMGAPVELAPDEPRPSRAPETKTEVDDENDDLGIEYQVIRELARSLQPRQQ